MEVFVFKSINHATSAVQHDQIGVILVSGQCTVTKNIADDAFWILLICFLYFLVVRCLQSASRKMANLLVKYNIMW